MVTSRQPAPRHSEKAELTKATPKSHSKGTFSCKFASKDKFADLSSICHLREAIPFLQQPDGSQDPRGLSLIDFLCPSYSNEAGQRGEHGAGVQLPLLKIMQRSMPYF